MASKTSGESHQNVPFIGTWAGGGGRWMDSGTYIAEILPSLIRCAGGSVSHLHQPEALLAALYVLALDLADAWRVPLLLDDAGLES